MSTLLALFSGLLAGAIHLAVLAARVRLACGGWPRCALALAPLGLLAPLLAIGLALALAPDAAWALLPGLLLARLLLLAPVACRREVAR